MYTSTVVKLPAVMTMLLFPAGSVQEEPAYIVQPPATVVV